MDDDEQLQLGGLTLRALATPGHAPEHLAWLLVDGGQPLALFSGGALLVGGVARTDLVSPDQTGPLTGAAWRSAQRLLELPDEVRVYPTHGAGSFCSTPGGAERITTIGAERAYNPLLPPPTRQPSASGCSVALAASPRISCGCVRSTASARGC
jgi:hydroxyacylglutathione hydrolase